MKLRTEHRHFDQETVKAKSIFNFYITVSQANVKELKYCEQLCGYYAQYRGLNCAFL